MLARTFWLSWSSLALLSLVVFSGCTQKLTSYKPEPRFEAKFFEQVLPSVTPSTFRTDPNRYQDVLVAWVGQIRSVRRDFEDSQTVLRFEVAHREVDWGRSWRQSDGFLSLLPRGEGEFWFSWRIQDARVAPSFSGLNPGDFVVVYGYPKILDSGQTALHPTKHVRIFRRFEVVFVEER